jgi:hypothetical protein
LKEHSIHGWVFTSWEMHMVALENIKRVSLAKWHCQRKKIRGLLKKSDKQEAIDEIISCCKMMSETLKREKVRKGERMDAC